MTSSCADTDAAAVAAGDANTDNYYTHQQIASLLSMRATVHSLSA